MNKVLYGLLMGAGFGIVFSIVFADFETSISYVGIVLGFLLYSVGLIKLRDAKTMSSNFK